MNLFVFSALQGNVNISLSLHTFNKRTAETLITPNEMHYIWPLTNLYNFFFLIANKYKKENAVQNSTNRKMLDDALPFLNHFRL